MRVLMLTLALSLSFAGTAPRAQTAIGPDDQKAQPAREQDPRPAQSEAQNSNRLQGNSSSRFSFSRVENGFVRLDNSTGEVAYCAPMPAWACQALPIQRVPDVENGRKDVSALSGLKAEIARLQEDIAQLKKELAAQKEPPPPRPPADLTPPSDKSPDVTIKLPSAEEVARAREFVEATWRRLVEMIATMQKDFMRKS